MRSSKAQIEALDFPAEEAAYSFSDPRAALKQEVAERLAAHRSRKGRSPAAKLVAIAEPALPRKTRSGADRIAAAVAERYAHSQSYRDFLAAEAKRAIEEANATAEIAARNAEAVTAVQQQLLAELDLWDAPESSPVPEDQAHTDIVRDPVPSPGSPRETECAPPSVSAEAPGLTVRLYEDVGMRSGELRANTSNRLAARGAETQYEELDEEHTALDEEIDFRRAPVFEAPPAPPVTIPANLIAFPRQLVAPRKSRPRLAEGPLREETETSSATAQLRIFEVEPDQISTSASSGVETVVPEWSSIHLDARPARVPSPASSAIADDHRPMQLYVPLQPAPTSQRLMSAAVDGCILGISFLGAVCVFALALNQLPTGATALLIAAATLLVLFVVYHLLFFTFSDATPGMRYARIGLCTFSDDNPTRSEMRRRTLAILLAACPLGLGLAWALLDEDGLGWHDRLSRMYQRSY